MKDRGVQRRQEPRCARGERGPVPGSARQGLCRFRRGDRHQRSALRRQSAAVGTRVSIAMQAVGGFRARSGGARAPPATADRACLGRVPRVLCAARHPRDRARRSGVSLRRDSDAGGRSGRDVSFRADRRQRLAHQWRGSLRQRQRARSGDGEPARAGLPHRGRGGRRSGTIVRASAAPAPSRVRRSCIPTCSRGWTRRSAGCCTNAASPGAASALPAVPEADIRHLLDTGISGQARFANNTASPLSYAVLDGFEVPMPLVQVIDRPRRALRSIEAVHRRLFQTRRRNRLERLGSGLRRSRARRPGEESDAIHR